ncbi:DUF1491 family protein [Sphingomonas bacterium]|uniref:DUF1491 family protein n=1 Tax=Sphingomonas bacterium TaxID=1895847 RepID=UPI001576873A|nr:DUF1491 family protein [Sphingomonas bacterium]
MTEARAASGLLVSALIRRIEAEGGHAMVLARGDATAGAMLLLLADRGEPTALLERTLGQGGYGWNDGGPADPAERPAYLDRRRNNDPDLWIVELDHPKARSIALDLLG